MKNLEQSFDIIVVGAGHAGCEAADVRCTSAGVYKVLFATFRLSVELPVQKHTGTG